MSSSWESAERSLARAPAWGPAGIDGERFGAEPRAGGAGGFAAVGVLAAVGLGGSETGRPRVNRDRSLSQVEQRTTPIAFHVSHCPQTIPISFRKVSLGAFPRFALLHEPASLLKQRTWRVADPAALRVGRDRSSCDGCRPAAPPPSAPG